MVLLSKFFICNVRGLNMKSAGIIRRVDELGRVVIPIDMRTQLGIEEKDSVEIYTDGSSIILEKHEKKCIFCGNTKKLTDFKDKIICDRCISSLSKKNNHK